MKTHKRFAQFLFSFLFFCLFTALGRTPVKASNLCAPAITVTTIGATDYENEAYPFVYIEEGYITQTTLNTGSGSTTVYATIVPIDAKSTGTLCISTEGNRMGNTPNQALYSDEALTNRIDNNDVGYPIKKTGIYYFVLWSAEEHTDYVDGILTDLVVYTYILGDTNTPLTEGEAQMMLPGDGSFRYYKFVLKEAANIRIVRETDKKFYSFSLCDSKKKVLYSYNSKNPDTDHIYFLKPGTYYVKTKGEKHAFGLGYRIDEDDNITYTGYENLFSFSTERSATVCVKISTKDYRTEPKVGGVLQLTGDTNCAISATLYNSKFKKISKTYKAESIDIINTSYAYWGLEPNSTYYLLVKTHKDSGIAYPRFHAEILYSPRDQGGSSKSKAQLLAKKFDKYGTIGAGNGKADWYKFYADKGETIPFQVKTTSQKGIKLVITNSKGKVIKKLTMDKGNQPTVSWDGVKCHCLFYLTLPAKDTYYIKLYSTDGGGGTYYLERCLFDPTDPAY